LYETPKSDSSGQASSAVTFFHRVDNFDIKVGNATLENNGDFPSSAVLKTFLRKQYPTMGLLCPIGGNFQQLKTLFRKRDKGAKTYSYKFVFFNCPCGGGGKDFSYWCVFPFSQFLLLRRKWLDRTVNHVKYGAMSTQGKQFMDEILTEDMRWNEMKLKLDSHFNHRPCEGPCGYEAAALNRMAV
jgi:hypothetical protein